MGGNAVKLGCDGCCTTINIIKFIELKKKKKNAYDRILCNRQGSHFQYKSDSLAGLKEFFIYLFIFVFSGLHLQHIEVPRLGVESEL